ncbi:hypothetical protein MVEN_01313800 [Mycena venus]|uniref:Uncharacterized protein n=1 Tax=Mycena venus TaxID=2733690 RepID=A0A8H6XZV3_9AGAR|nr:hypothetical protein MVEN_01313800 [Mycena venus]
MSAGSIPFPLAGASRVPSTDSEKTLVELPIPPHPRACSHPRQYTTHNEGAGATRYHHAKSRPRGSHSRPYTDDETSSGAGATTHHQGSKKSTLYRMKRGPGLRQAGRNVVERVASIFSERAPSSRTRAREPTYAADLRAMIAAVVEKNLLQEEQEKREDERLRTLLAGRVIGGQISLGA